ncbi:oxygenase MpaB family protein [Mycolicibacterium sp. Dal123E01]|uniref:oxygenase MpaB family protein n=1 Tax=Mycolicibacterium sp. Dal123E01 TaxID=3457578 RepID=UPI00403E8193
MTDAISFPAAMKTASEGPARVRNFQEAQRIHGHRADQYVKALMRTDPLADAVVADLAELPRHGGKAMVDQALREGIDAVPDAPQSLRELFAQLDRVPFWLDLGEVDRGGAACVRHAQAAGIALGAASLVASYTNEAATRPLAITRRFIDQADLRAYETFNWWLATVTPGGLHRHGAGFARTVKVRLIHAHVRRHLLQDGAWRTDEWGVPINQADMAYTVVTFSAIPLRAMRRLGVRYSPTELSAIYRLWRYMGYLMGVEEALLPAGKDESIRLERLYHLLSPPPDEDCRELVNALIDGPLSGQLHMLVPRVLKPVANRCARPLIQGLARSFAGDTVADRLGLPDTPLKHLPTLIGAPASALNRLRGLTPYHRRQREHRSLAVTTSRLAQQARRLGATHDLVEPSEVEPIVS